MSKIGIIAKDLREFIDSVIKKNPDAMVVISVDKLEEIDKLLSSGAKLIWFSIKADLSKDYNIELVTDDILKVFV